MIYTSTENSKIKEIKKLNNKKYRDEYNKFIIEGEHLILEAEKNLQNGDEKMNYCIVQIAKLVPLPFSLFITSDMSTLMTDVKLRCQKEENIR